MKTANKVGRPSVKKDHRAALLSAARQLFVELDYDKVSLRAIAKKAQVDSALIRYYFQSKLGLFTCLLKETEAPIAAQLNQFDHQVTSNSSEVLMATYYRVMSENPDFPKLVFKMISMPNTSENQVFKDILKDVLAPKHISLFSVMKEKGFLKESVDPICAQISFFSMMIFPFLIPDMVKQAMGVEITPEFMEKLCQQNTQLLAHGCLRWSLHNGIAMCQD